MEHWLDSWPALRVMEKEIPADIYNTIRVGLLRHSLPWTLPVDGIRCLTAILDHRAWVCVDACHNDLPILAWTGFRTAGRDSLDTPVRCELHLYHTHAGLLMGRALDELDAALRDRLAPPHTGGENNATG
jgi:hypothetical protein